METIYRIKHLDELAKHWADRATEAADELNGINGPKNKTKRKVAQARADLLAEVADMLGKTIIEP
jgi:hypothetical protein